MMSSLAIIPTSEVQPVDLPVLGGISEAVQKSRNTFRSVNPAGRFWRKQRNG
jgi:hypothetical protein